MRDSDFLLDEFVAAAGSAVQCQCQGYVPGSASKPSVSAKTLGLGLAPTAHLLRFLTCWLEPFEWVDIRPLLLVYKAFGFACHSSFLTHWVTCWQSWAIAPAPLWTDIHGN
ncbi:hypothetical protein JMJ77_0004887 [Colletotrichum scovillei]|uniref:Uncharacterized protein n=1 Tax=Colletotrichum scovillei TaxID=1209932 RepID=A0A9P7RG12_9PEZI|nr:hypothetical protein JMJ77_0004887 [Colletotrichum scovillei]KAG7076129.1 hypothetical protein JMJ76_0013397 [Colletotrichum scovillei]KAG7083285.1 hypothetical protein JMJ78_0008732 [Colletotrichum scovillei]